MVHLAAATGVPFLLPLARTNIANLGTGRHASERERNSLSDASKIKSKLDLEASMVAKFFFHFLAFFGPPRDGQNLAFYMDFDEINV